MHSGRLVAGEVLVRDLEHEAHPPHLLDVHAQAPCGRNGDHEPVLGVGLVEGRPAGEEGLPLVLVTETDVLREGVRQLSQHPAQVGLRDGVAAAMTVVHETVGALALTRGEQLAGGRRDAVGDIQAPFPDVDDAGMQFGAFDGHARGCWSFAGSCGRFAGVRVAGRSGAGTPDGGAKSVADQE